MSIWKKAISVTASAALLASLFASAFVGTVSANAAPQALSGTCNPASCSQVANSGLIVMSGTTNTFPAATAAGGGARKLTVSGAGATFVTTSAGHFALESATVFTPPGPTAGMGEFYLAGEVAVSTGAALSAADTVSVIGASAGTATVTEWLWTGTGGSPANTWLPDGNTWALTITANTAAYQVSAAASTITTGTAALCATALTAASATSGPGSAFACVTVKNLAPTPAPIVGASVTLTIQPFGLVLGAQTATLTTGPGGVASFSLGGSGLAGVSTISASATWLGVTTALTPASFTWTGTPNTLKLASKKYTSASSVNKTDALFLQATDAAGNTLPQSGAAGGFTSSPVGLVFATGTGTGGAGFYDVACPASAAEQVYTITGSIVAPALTSNTVTFVCNPGIASTLKVAVSSPSIPAGGSTAFTVTGKDAAGNPIADGTVISAVASAGVAIGSSTVNTSTTLNGVATFTYVAVNNNGPVTLTAVEFVNSGLTATGTVGVGQPPAASGSAASALGVTRSGPFSKSTKLPARGHYVTIWFSGLTAGGTVVIQVATKTGSSWSAFVNKTSRVADTGGNVYFYWKSSTAAWLSIRAAGTNAVQVRWR